MQGVHQQKQGVLEANQVRERSGFEGNLREGYGEEWVPSSISLKTIEWANVKNSERE